MDQLRMGLRFAAAFVATLISRLRRGPARPSWSLLFEALIRTLQRTALVIAERDALEQRRSWQAIAAPNALRAEVRVEPVDAGGVAARWVIARGVPADAPALVYFHGGSYRYGSFESHAELASRLSRAGAVRVLFVEYRLAPPHVFPAAVDDAVTATRWLAAIEAPSRILVGGDSAGAALALATLLSLRDAGDALPAGGVLICPWVDVSARGGSLETNARWDWALPQHFIDWARGYAPEAEWTNPLVSPSFAELRGLPRLLIQIGGAEMLLDQVRCFAEKATAAGVDVHLTEEPDMVHDWHLFAAFSKTAARSIDEAGAFMRSALQPADVAV